MLILSSQVLLVCVLIAAVAANPPPYAPRPYSPEKSYEPEAAYTKPEYKAEAPYEPKEIPVYEKSPVAYPKAEPYKPSTYAKPAYDEYEVWLVI